jgi:hypothetical protein
MYQVFIDVMQLCAYLQRGSGCHHARLQCCDEWQRLATRCIELQPADLQTDSLQNVCSLLDA